MFFTNATYIGLVTGNILRINVGGDLVWSRNTPRISNGKWGYIDVLGNKIIPCIYDAAKNISNDLAIVKKWHKWGVVKLDNTDLIPFSYESINIQDNTIHCYISRYIYEIFNFNGEKIGKDKDIPEEDYYDEDDPWDANAELDYIRNNGGDWIDDIG